MVYLMPVFAVLFSMLVGGIIFTLLGYQGFAAVGEIFLTPLFDISRWEDLGIKAAPLISIGVGLSICFRANVWNIGAEGQYIVGALAGTGIALLTYELQGWWILPLMCIMGALGAMAFAFIPAYLRTHFNVNEILSSLMLNYAAIQLLNYLMRGPWKDPDGFNFPQTRIFNDSQVLPEAFPYSFMHMGVPMAFAIALLTWFVLSRSIFGFQIRVSGEAPIAAHYGGFNEKRTIWLVLILAGGFAGLAGIFEASGAFQQLTPSFPVGYGYTAIIVAFLGRLNPLGIIFAGIVMAVTYVGGELAQVNLGMPDSAAGIFQAIILFVLLASDFLLKTTIKVEFQGGTEAKAEQEGN